MVTTSVETKLRRAFPNLEISIQAAKKDELWEAELQCSLPGRHKFAWRNFGRTELEAIDRVYANAYFHYVQSPAHEAHRQDRSGASKYHPHDINHAVAGVTPHYLALK